MTECALDWSGQVLISWDQSFLFLDTQSWQLQEIEETSKDDERLGEVKASMLRIIDIFKAPLEAKGVKITCCVWMKLKI